MRRSQPDCAALVDVNTDVQKSVAEIYSPKRRSHPSLKYLSNVDQEFKDVFEECDTEDYYQQNRADVMSDMAQTDRALCPFRTYVDVDHQVSIPLSLLTLKTNQWRNSINICINLSFLGKIYLSHKIELPFFAFDILRN